MIVMPTEESIIGKIFQGITFLGYTQSRKWIRKSGRKKEVSIRYCICRCHCGRLFETRARLVTCGILRSCGCLNRSAIRKIRIPRKRTKRRDNISTWRSWCAMRNRCNKPSDKDYPSYGGRGIAVCERWNNSFDDFLEDVGPRPEDTTIGRIDNNGPYCKENCRWETRSMQQRNKRTTTFYTVRGKTGSVAELCEIFNIRRYTVYQRLHLNWDVEKAFTTPPFKQFNRWSMPSNKSK